jgi:SAM-dependent methyltransferase
MHDTAMAAGTAFFETYFAGEAPRVLDVGAMDVNGSLRSVAPLGAKYVGVDLEPGPGVDVVLGLGQGLPFGPDTFDACVSVSCMEHDFAFWDSFLQMAVAVRPGGFIFLDVPSNGPYHSYPTDNWRFYPDAGLALANWAQRQGQPVQLIESGILRRRTDVWNDFVAVFQKHPAAPVRERFLLDAFADAMNTRRLGRLEMAEPVSQTEDVLLASQALLAAEAQAEQARQQATEAAANQARLEHEVARVTSLVEAQAEQARQQAAEAAANQARLGHEIAQAEQARQQAAEAAACLETLRAQAAATQARLEHEMAQAEQARQQAAEAAASLETLRAQAAATQARLEREVAQASGLAEAKATEFAALQALHQTEVAEGEARETMLNSRLAAMENQLEAIFRSSSWRVTRPLRWLGYVLKRDVRQ